METLTYTLKDIQELTNLINNLHLQAGQNIANVAMINKIMYILQNPQSKQNADITNNK